MSVYRDEQAILGALKETENALVADGNGRARRTRLVEAVDASRIALQLSRELYLRGLADLLTVLDDQRAAYALEDQPVQSGSHAGCESHRVLKALGGGWDAASATEVPQ